jgi:hypothetical protein
MRRLAIASCLIVAAAGIAVFLVRDSERPLTVHHIRDWHFVPREQYGQDVSLEGAALDKACAKHLDDVEQVQKEQLPVLHALVERGVKVVYVEGLSGDEVADWPKMAAIIREQLKDEPRLKSILADALATTRQADGSLEEKAQSVVKETESLLNESRELRLKFGSVALIEGLEVRALDDAKALAESKPTGMPLRSDPAKTKAREEAWGRILAGAPEGEVIVILGASHDVAVPGRRLTLDRITVPKVKLLWGE